MNSFEINFDGLVGPTHNYGGLSLGNVASTKHKAQTSNPKEAALQGLKKMKKLMELGLKQAVLPPHERPHIYTLRQLGFTGTDAEIMEKCFQVDPNLLINCSSASAMWTANAATISPSADCHDGKVHITPANLSNMFHRLIERETTERIFKAIFKNEKHFVIHPSLPSGTHFGDEGAANHTRLCQNYGDPGVEFFVFGRYAFLPGKPKPKFFPARQTDEASRAIIRLHGLDPRKVVLAQQNPFATDAGVFHNDVISVGNQNVFIYHEQAFFDADRVINELKERFLQTSKQELCTIKVSAHEVTIAEAVHTYLFNSQLVSLDNGQMVLIAPKESEDNRVVKKSIDHIISGKQNPINEVCFFDMKQSMKNGGGPACLRLRFVLTEDEINHMNPQVLLTDELYKKLIDWVEDHYRDQLSPEDLADPKLLEENRVALDEISQILQLGSVYEFQK